MAKIAVKLGDHSQKIGKDFGKAELVLADANSSQPIPMSEADAFAIASDPVGLASLAFRFTDGDIRSIRGGVTPTFTRATVRTLNWDWEGKPQNILSGEVPIEGLRRVYNRIQGTSENFSGYSLGAGSPAVTVGQSDSLGTTRACRLTWGAAATGYRVYITGLTAIYGANSLPGRSVVISVYAKSNTGSAQTFRFGLTSSAILDYFSPDLTATTEWQRFSFLKTFGAGDTGQMGAAGFASSAAGGTADIIVEFLQVEDVTGQSNQNPSEYVSVGVLSTPYHGANVDGVKYFTTQNGNTVSSNVVTEAAGAALPTTYAKGYYPDVASVNLCLQSENFGTTWVAIGTPTRVAAAKRCGSITLDLIGDDDAGVLEGYSQAITLTGDAVKSWCFFFAQGSSTSSVFQFRDTTAGANRGQGIITWTAGIPSVAVAAGTLLGVDPMGGGIWRARIATTSATAANVNQLIVYPATTNALVVADVGTIYMGGVQAENATTCSSYIPTTTGTVARNADQMAITSLGSWFNAAEGTIVVAARPFMGVTAIDQYIADIGDGTNNERFSTLRMASTQAQQFIVIDTAGTQASLSGAALTTAVDAKIANCYKVNDYESYTNGARQGTGDQAGANLPTPTGLAIGYTTILGTTTQFRGHISSLSYYPRRLGNSILAQLST